MKTVPLADLKKDLSKFADQASQGTVFEVTKHNRPYVTLGPSQATGLFIGSKVGKGSIKPATRQATKGQWLKYLTEDRN